MNDPRYPNQPPQGPAGDIWMPPGKNENINDRMVMEARQKDFTWYAIGTLFSYLFMGLIGIAVNFILIRELNEAEATAQMKLPGGDVLRFMLYVGWLIALPSTGCCILLAFL